MKKPQKPISQMNEHELIRFMGRFPDKIIYPGEEGSITDSGKWKCSMCGKPRPESGPCECGSIFWEKAGD